MLAGDPRLGRDIPPPGVAGEVMECSLDSIDSLAIGAVAGAGVGHSGGREQCSTAQGGDGLALLVEGRGFDLLLCPAGQVHLHSDTLLLSPARLTPQILLVQSVPRPAFFHVRSSSIL